MYLVACHGDIFSKDNTPATSEVEGLNLKPGDILLHDGRENIGRGLHPVT